MTATLAATYLSTLLDNENHPLSREAKRLTDVLNKLSRDFPELRRAAARETLAHMAVSTDAGYQQRECGKGDPLSPPSPLLCAGGAACSGQLAHEEPAIESKTQPGSGGME